MRNKILKNSYWAVNSGITYKITHGLEIQLNILNSWTVCGELWIKVRSGIDKELTQIRDINKLNLYT